ETPTQGALTSFATLGFVVQPLWRRWFRPLPAFGRNLELLNVEQGMMNLEVELAAVSLRGLRHSTFLVRCS
ncbi:MAG: hypothetical protein ACE5KM_21985, partial [Planctomycetaceae bacterium]